MDITSREAVRVHTSVLAAAEKRLLVRLAGRLPRRIHSDHLTALAALSMAGTGVCFWIASAWPAGIAVAIALLAVNWFGDSLDGTLARVRRQERPRYGFYVDHVLDVVGILALVGGLVLGGWMSPTIGTGFLVAYYLLMIEIALATHVLGRFHMSFWRVGPTELRIALAVGALQLLRSPSVELFGGSYLLFDIGGTAAIACLAVTFVLSALRHGRELYLLEPRVRSDRRPSGSGLDPVPSGSGLDPVPSGSGLDPVPSGSGLDPVPSGSGLRSSASSPDPARQLL